MIFNEIYGLNQKYKTPFYRNPASKFLEDGNNHIEGIIKVIVNNDTHIVCLYFQAFRSFLLKIMISTIH